jgi:hypothetical protein
MLSAGEKFSRVGTVDLGQQCHSTPAVSGGRIYFRTLTKVMCLKVK